MRILPLCVALIVTTACAAAPAPTPTAATISTAQLESLLLMSGDLPAGLDGAQVREPPAMFAALPTAAVHVYRQIARGTQPAGGVAVFVYPDDDQRTAAYEQLVNDLGASTPITGVGDEAQTSSASGLLTFSDLVFRRCQVVAHIRLMGTDRDAVTAYARRLDGRVQVAVCP